MAVAHMRMTFRLQSIDGSRQLADQTRESRILHQFLADLIAPMTLLAVPLEGAQAS